MAKSHSLAFSTMNGTASSFFAFITGATTVSGLLLCLFGLTSFGFMLTGDSQISAYTVLRGLTLLPNPLNFIRDCNQIVVAFSNSLAKLQTVHTGSDWFDKVAGILYSIGSLVIYVFAFLISIILLPFYLVWFFIRCGAVLFTSIGLSTYVPTILKYDWQPVQWLIDFIGGIV